jgi:EmrB/QacA subfamily drug resistance transporter
MEVDVTRPSERRRVLGLLSVLFGQMMLIIDGTVVNVALPAIQADLKMTGVQLSWVTNSYLIAFGGLLLLFGRLGDLVGRRKVFLLGIGLFTAASAACGLASSAEMLIAARFVQGIGAAGASSVVLAIIATEYPEPKARAKAMSGYMFVSIAGGSVALVLGGALTQMLDWHWIFLINLPIGALTIPLCRAVLRETPAQGLGKGLDVGGAVLVTGAAMTAIYALVATANHAWTDAAVLGPAAASLALGAGFLVLEARHRNPLLPLRVLRIRSLMATSVIRGCMFLAMYAVFFFGALELSHQLGLGPMEVGMSFLPQSLVTAAMSLGLSAWLVNRFGPYRVLLAGLSLLAVALVTFAIRDPEAPYWPGRFVSYALIGVGAGASFLPLITIAMSDVPPSDVGLGSAIINFSLQLAGAIDLAILVAVAAHSSQRALVAGASARDAATSGYHAAYTAGAIGVTIGLVIAAVLIRNPTAIRDAARRAS